MRGNYSDSATTPSSLSGGELRNASPYVAYRSVRIGHLRRRTRAGRVPRALRQATRNAPRSHRRNAQRGGREEVASIDIASLVDDGNWCAPAGSIREVIGRARGTPVRQAEYREGHDDRLSESLPQRGFGGAGFGGPGRRGGRAGFGTGGAGAVLRRAQPSTFCREARPFMQSPYALLSAAREELFECAPAHHEGHGGGGMSRRKRSLFSRCCSGCREDIPRLRVTR